MGIRVHLAALLLFATLPLSAQTTPASAPNANNAGPTTDSNSVPMEPTSTVLQADEGAKGLLLEKNEGELRMRRPRPSVPNPASQIMLKAGPKNNGSQHLVVATEEIAPGASIPTHKHLTQDEVVLIHSGTAHVRLGDQERDLHVGSMVFIPANTWVGLKNTSTEVMSITFVFSAPGFDDYLRCTSVPAGEKPTPMTQENWQQCQHEGHALFEAADGRQK